MERITPEKVQKLNSNEIFVFGSNREGRHGKGAALWARQNAGAIYGQSTGLQGQSYAVITKELRKDRFPVTLTEIAVQVNVLLKYVRLRHNKNFLVTKLGCDLARFKVEQIAPLFEKFVDEENVWLPKEFIDEIKKLSK